MASASRRGGVNAFMPWLPPGGSRRAGRRQLVFALVDAARGIQAGQQRVHAACSSAQAVRGERLFGYGDFHSCSRTSIKRILKALNALHQPQQGAVWKD